VCAFLDPQCGVHSRWPPGAGGAARPTSRGQKTRVRREPGNKGANKSHLGGRLQADSEECGGRRVIERRAAHHCFDHCTRAHWSPSIHCCSACRHHLCALRICRPRCSSEGMEFVCIAAHAARPTESPLSVGAQCTENDSLAMVELHVVHQDIYVQPENELLGASGSRTRRERSPVAR
jgi:hypothetical protein